MVFFRVNEANRVEGLRAHSSLGDDREVKLLTDGSRVRWVGRFMHVDQEVDLGFGQLGQSFFSVDVDPMSGTLRRVRRASIREGLPLALHPGGGIVLHYGDRLVLASTEPS